MSQLRLSFRFLAPLYHGRRDRGAAEWPPSPLRVFQALVAASARRTGAPDSQSVEALKWLERQQAPTVVAPDVVSSTGYRLSVPNNTMDAVAKAWCRGNDSNVGDANPATHRTMKTVRPTWMRDGDTVHYLWTLEEPVSDAVQGHANVLCTLAADVSAIGWGLDLAVGHGAVAPAAEPQALAGQHWYPSGSTDDGLRLPVAGTLDVLLNRFARFQSRLHGATLDAPPPMAAYQLVCYRRASDPLPRPVTAFTLLKPDASGFRPFDTVRGVIVAGLARHATRVVAQRAGWDEERINRFVLGHGEADEAVGVGPRRFAYLPLPTLEARGATLQGVVGSVRRLMLASFDHTCEPEHVWVRRALSGQELVSEGGDVVALLSLVPRSDRVVRRYLESASSWATVTPVVLPGYDDPSHLRRRLKGDLDAGEQQELIARLGNRTEALLRKAIIHAGFSPVLAEHATLDWRQVGFLPGADLASRYRVPDHLRRFPRMHVRLQWRDDSGRPLQVPGPVCVGGGRFYGLGLFANTTDESY